MRHAVSPRRLPFGLLCAATALAAAEGPPGARALMQRARQASQLAPPADLALNVIDGLGYAGGRLAAIQNGIEPHRAIVLDFPPTAPRSRAPAFS